MAGLSPGRFTRCAGGRWGLIAGAKRGCRGGDRDQGRTAAHRPTAPLRPHEPRRAREAERDSHEEVQAQSEDVLRRVDPQRLFEDAEARVTGDVEREDSWRPYAPAP